MGSVWSDLAPPLIMTLTSLILCTVFKKQRWLPDKEYRIWEQHWNKWFIYSKTGTNFFFPSQFSVKRMFHLGLNLIKTTEISGLKSCTSISKSSNLNCFQPDWGATQLTLKSLARDFRYRRLKRNLTGPLTDVDIQSISFFLGYGTSVNLQWLFFPTYVQTHFCGFSPLIMC